MGLWAVSGGSGFLGGHLARRLAAAGIGVRTLDPEAPGPDARAGVDWLAGDVRRAADAAALCAGADVAVHAAAALPVRGPAEQIRSVTVDGTAALLAAAAEAGVRRVVLVSSAVVYGLPTAVPLTEVTPPAPFEPYGRAKLAAEGLCAAFGRRGLETVVLRPTAFVGPGRLGVFGLLFDWVREGRRIYTLGPGTNRYQLLAVEDLVEAILLAAEAPVSGETFVLGAEEVGTAREELEALVAHARSPSRVTPLPARPARAALAALDLLGFSPLGAWHYRTADRDFAVDATRARERLGWSPSRTSRDALLAAWDWYVTHRDGLGRTGTTHRVRWDERALALVRRAS